MNFRFTLVNRLYTTFSIILVAVITSSMITFSNLQTNRKLLRQVAYVHSPSTSSLDELAHMLIESRLLIKNWVFIEHKSQTQDKTRLRQIYSQDYPNLQKKLNTLKTSWNEEDIILYNEIEGLIVDSLFPMYLHIMEQLNTYDAYEEPAIIFELRPMVEDGGEVMIVANKILNKLERLNTLIQQSAQTTVSDIADSMNNFLRSTIITGVFLIVFSLLTMYVMSKYTIKPIVRLREFLKLMSQGILPDDHIVTANNEIGDIARTLNNFIDNMKRTSQFALEIGKENFEAEYTALGEDDVLGNSLITMRENLKKASEKEQKRKKEDEIRNWTTQGLAQFGDILRQSANIESLSYDVIEKALELVGAIQGALYILEDSNESDKHFRMTAAIAYGRKKLMSRRVEMEEGLVGRCAFEQATVYLKQVPQDYVRITSGLGDANPSVILLIPLMSNEKIYGIMELASFNPLEEYQIKFLEQVSENIAGTLATVKINEKTAILLEESQHKGEELSAQEEEMRQNMEELQATIEESARREVEMNEIFNAINNTIGNIELDSSGIIKNANDKYAQMLGMKTGEIIGREHRNLLKLNHKQEDLYNEIWESITAGNKAEVDLCYPTPNGDVWLKETYTPISDMYGDYSKILGLAVDVSENKTKDRAIHAFKREIYEQGESIKATLEQLTQLKETSKQREADLIKEKEISDEEYKLQIESMRIQIEELEEKLQTGQFE